MNVGSTGVVTESEIGTVRVFGAPVDLTVMLPL